MRRVLAAAVALTASVVALPGAAASDGSVVAGDTAPVFHPWVSTDVGSWPESAAIADVTGDGLADVLMTTSFYFDAANDASYAAAIEAMDLSRAGGVKSIAILTESVLK